MKTVIFLYGLLIGSFLNVCIYRIPREESIVFPSSHCFSCGTNLKWYDLVPVLSYMVQKGKCRYCGEKFSSQYPIIELFNGVLYLLIYIKFDFTLEFFFYCILFSILMVVALIDLKHMIIPDVLILCIFILSILYKIAAYVLWMEPFNIVQSVGGLILSGLFFLLIIFLSKGGMGEGDVTLISSLGFILGIKDIFLTIFLSFVVGAIISVFLLVTKIKGRKDPIPFGPFIIFSFFMVVFWGNQFVQWYLNNFY